MTCAGSIPEITFSFFEGKLSVLSIAEVALVIKTEHKSIYQSKFLPANL